MKFAAILLGFILCAQALAMPPSETPYQDGVLVSFTNTGTSKMDSGRIYTIQAGGSTFTIEPNVVFLYKPSVLMGQLPGTHVLARTDGKLYFVKIGNRESKYSILAAANAPNSK